MVYITSDQIFLVLLLLGLGQGLNQAEEDAASPEDVDRGPHTAVAVSKLLHSPYIGKGGGGGVGKSCLTGELQYFFTVKLLFRSVQFIFKFCVCPVQALAIFT